MGAFAPRGRASRAAARACVWLAGTCWLALVAGMLHPWAVGAGRLGVCLGRGYAGVVWSAAPISASWPAKDPAPRWSIAGPPGVQTSGMVWATSAWRVSTSNMTVTVGAGAPMSLWAVWLPLWPPALLLTIGWIALLVRAGRAGVRRRECQGCGYDLAGLAGERCPECGAAARARAARGE